MNKIARVKILMACTLMVAMFVGSESAWAKESSPSDPTTASTRFCQHSYKIEQAGQNPITVCAQYELSSQNIDYLRKQFFNAGGLYLNFLRNEKMRKTPKDIDFTINPTIYMVTFETINNPSFFKRANPDEKIVARYVPVKGWFFLTNRIFDTSSDGYTDFPHEVAHFVNDLLKIKGPQDESLADEFESFYAKKMKDVRISSVQKNSNSVENDNKQVYNTDWEATNNSWGEASFAPGNEY